jgi:hypothetical protein
MGYREQIDFASEKLTVASSLQPSTFSRSPFSEPHYTVAQVAEMWNLSEDAVRRLFRQEPGVLVFGDPNPRRKRRYTTLRIPQSVLERVHGQYSFGK